MKEDIYQYLYKRDKPMSIKIMGIILAIFSIGGLASAPLLGIAMALAAFGLITYQSGIEVDFTAQTYRLVTAFGSKGFGDWKPFPPIKCVSVFKTNLVSTTYGRSNASITTRNEVIQVNLATEQNERIQLHETENMDEAMTFAKDVAQKLNLKVWDATTKEGKWVE